MQSAGTWPPFAEGADAQQVTNSARCKQPGCTADLISVLVPLVEQVHSHPQVKKVSAISSGWIKAVVEVEFVFSVGSLVFCKGF